MPNRGVPNRGVLVRPMTLEDVAEAQRVSDVTFLELDAGTRRRDDPAPQGRGPTGAAAWEVRTRHYLHTDPAGCWVAEDDGRMLGFATSYRRDLTWILATFTVLPALQGRGIGRELLAAALTHARGCLRGMLAASDDPRAYRVYRQAGFTLHPQLRLRGVVDRSALPAVEHVREGTDGDLEMLDSLDRQVRGAARGSDHAVLRGLYRLLVTDRSTGSGYAYVDERGQVGCLAATNRRTATRLLWEAMAAAPPGEEVELTHVTVPNEWAVDVGLAARLSVGTEGFLALRGMKPPVPYVHHGTFL
ncbi:MAG: GNAT family N-acetyltransferase [Marmoricola sp.]